MAGTFILLAVVLGACGTSAPVSRPTLPEPTYRIIYVVHGDASYLYHDAEGRARQADADAVAQAHTVARELADAEVLIFHQRSQQRFLGLFPRSDGTLYHYRSGHLVREQQYDRTPRPLAAEAALLEATPARDSLPSVFLYFGHALPEQGGKGYHRSYPAWPVTVDRMAAGLGRLSGGPFDLAVLSTCTSGTAGTLAALAPHARYVVASPEDVHLSHLDGTALLYLRRASFDARRLAEHVAQQSFERLTARTQTAVTLGVYDMEYLAPALAVIAPDYEERLAGIDGTVVYRDCAGDSAFRALLETGGVTVWHRPARFGRKQDADHHSGWGCPVPSQPPTGTLGRR